MSRDWDFIRILECHSFLGFTFLLYCVCKLALILASLTWNTEPCFEGCSLPISTASMFSVSATDTGIMKPINNTIQTLPFHHLQRWKIIFFPLQKIFTIYLWCKSVLFSYQAVQRCREHSISLWLFPKVKIFFLRLSFLLSFSQFLCLIFIFVLSFLQVSLSQIYFFFSFPIYHPFLLGNHFNDF